MMYVIYYVCMYACLQVFALSPDKYRGQIARIMKEEVSVYQHNTHYSKTGAIVAQLCV